MVKQFFLISVLLLSAGILLALSDAASSIMTGDSSTVEQTEQENQIKNITLINHGGSLEGHTPRGFAGSGTGLFVGDNLNANFPEGDGVQAFITFDISPLEGTSFESVVLTSDNVHTRGTPFQDLGNLIVESVAYDRFSPRLWDQETTGFVCTLATEATSSVVCDVTATVSSLLEKGESLLQLRLRLEQAGDSDGQSDMVLFYKRGSNINEPGIFTLDTRLTQQNTEGQKQDQANTALTVPIVVHLVKDSAEASTLRTQEEVGELLKESQKIWNQAGITLEIEIDNQVLSEDLINATATGDFRQLYTLPRFDTSRLHVFYVSDLFGSNGVAVPPHIALIADKTSVDDFRATAHEIGHLLGLEHTTESRERLMFSGANGRVLSDAEITFTREFVQMGN